MEDLFRKNITWIVFWTICLLGIVALSLWPSLHTPKGYDLYFHFLCYFALAGIPLAFFPRRKVAALCAGLIPVLGLLLEYVQQSIVGRNFSTEDMLANNIGTVAGIVLGVCIRFFVKLKRYLEVHMNKIAYLANPYPALSHTFIYREIESLREEGLEIATASVTRSAEIAKMSEKEQEEAEGTFFLKEVTIRSAINSFWKVFFIHPRVFIVCVQGLRLSSLPGPNIL